VPPLQKANNLCAIPTPYLPPTPLSSLRCALCTSLPPSAHECRKAYLAELEHILPGVDLTPAPNTSSAFPMLVLPTMQHAQQDLVQIGGEVEQEKDRCLETFMSFAGSVCAKLGDLGK